MALELEVSPASALELTGDLSLEQLCGQLLTVGFQEPELPSWLSESLSRGERGGVILFKRNTPSLELTARNCRAVAAATPKPLPPFIAVDQEGGRVRRLPSPPALLLPPMRELARYGAAFVERAAHALGRELRALGFNLDFAPVADVDSNPENPIIGDRAFGSTSEEVIEHAGAFLRGLTRAGVLGCLKHFPGHGDTLLDSHLDLPRVDHDRPRLERVELAPFRALASEAPTLMSAHVVFPALASQYDDRFDAFDTLPATLSRRVMTELLRNEIGFRGVAFSDDLEMRALSDRLPVEQSAVGAVRAGCDALLVCRQRDLQERAHHALVATARSDPDFFARCRIAAARGIQLRRQVPPDVAGDLDTALDASRGIAESLTARPSEPT